MGNLEIATTARMFGRNIRLRFSPLKPAYHFLINRKRHLNRCEDQHDEAIEEIVGNVFSRSPGLLKKN